MIAQSEQMLRKVRTSDDEALESRMESALELGTHVERHSELVSDLGRKVL